MVLMAGAAAIMGDILTTETDKEERPKFMGPDDITDQLNYPSLETYDEELLVI